MLYPGFAGARRITTAFNMNAAQKAESATGPISDIARYWGLHRRSCPVPAHH